MQVQPLEPRRVRYPRGAYGWVDLKIVTGGVLQSIGPEAAFTYLFLCAVGNTQGVSFWSEWRMAQILGLPLEAVQAALRKLHERDLIATNGRVIQVLPLVSSEQAVAEPDRSTATTGPTVAVTARGTSRTPEEPSASVDLGEAEIQRHEAEARRRLAKITSRVCPDRVRQVARALALEARRTRRG
jgi:hypothetical protein